MKLPAQGARTQYAPTNVPRERGEVVLPIVAGFSRARAIVARGVVAVRGAMFRGLVRATAPGCGCRLLPDSGVRTGFSAACVSACAARFHPASWAPPWVAVLPIVAGIWVRARFLGWGSAIAYSADSAELSFAAALPLVAGFLHGRVIIGDGFDAVARLISCGFAGA